MTEPQWPDPCACGHSGYSHHVVYHGTKFGPDYFCKGIYTANLPEGDGICRCTEYRPASPVSEMYDDTLERSGQ